MTPKNCDNNLDHANIENYEPPMNSSPSTDFGFVQVKAIALAVSDLGRAKRFYGETLGFPAETAHQMDNAFLMDNVILLLKPTEEWYGKPTADLNARITLQVRNSYETEKMLKERGVTISDPVTVYGSNPVGAFLDSEGNKIWFCSETEK